MGIKKMPRMSLESLGRFYPKMFAQIFGYESELFRKYRATKFRNGFATGDMEITITNITFKASLYLTAPTMQVIDVGHQGLANAPCIRTINVLGPFS